MRGTVYRAGATTDGIKSDCPGCSRIHRAVVQSHVKGREERKTSSENQIKEKRTKNRRLVVIHVVAVGVDRFVAQTVCADMKLKTIE